MRLSLLTSQIGAQVLVAGGETAIDRDDRAGDPGGFVGGEEEGSVGDVVRLARHGAGDTTSPASRKSGSSLTRSLQIGVSIEPGQMQFTRTPFGPYLTAMF